MPIVPTPASRLETVQAAMRETMADRSDPEIRNVGAAATLLGDVIEYPISAGRFYQVPPTPYPVGLRLQTIAREVRQAQRARKAGDTRAQAALSALYAEAVDLFGRSVRPMGGLRRLLWPVTRNPFRQASEAEIGALLLFFYSWTMRTRVRFSTEATAESHGR